jgi:hypothetical protein
MSVSVAGLPVPVTRPDTAMEGSRLSEGTLHHKQTQLWVPQCDTLCRPLNRPHTHTRTHAHTHLAERSRLGLQLCHREDLGPVISTKDRGDCRFPGRKLLTVP